MPKRRGHGEGSIHQRADGRWVATVELGYVNGKRKRKYVYGETRREVSEELSKLRQAIREGRMAAVDGKMNLATYLDKWLETIKTTRRPNTYRRYEQLVRLHVKPLLGPKRLSTLKALDLQQLYAKKLDELAPRTVVHLHRVVHGALKQAVRWALIPTNPAEKVAPPRAPEPEMSAFTFEEVDRFLEVARGHRLEALFVLAVMTGARRGELLALRWRDVDLDARTVRIAGSVQKDLSGKRVIAEPKTKQSRRSVLLSDTSVQALKRRRSVQAQERLQAGPLWSDLDLVFAEPDGAFLRVSVVRREYKRLLEQANVPQLRFHDLRHTAATLALQQGRNPKAVSDMLGHAGVAITLDTYSHVTPTMQQAVADALEAGVQAARTARLTRPPEEA